MPGSGGTAASADRASGTAVAVLKNRNTIGDFTTVHQVSAAVAKRLQTFASAGDHLVVPE